MRFSKFKQSSDEHYYQLALGNNEESINFYNTRNPGSSGLLEQMNLIGQGLLKQIILK